jgi:hypothetical protein
LGIVERQLALNQSLLGEDILGVVIRAHIHIESELIEFIQARLRPNGALDALDLDYKGRVKLALALGIPAEFKPVLNNIGSLRNKFAHRIDASLTEQEATNFYNALSPNAKRIANESYNNANKTLGLDKDAKLIDQLEPKEQIILYFTTIWGAMATAASHAKMGTE